MPKLFSTHNFPVYNFLLINILLFALLGYAWLQGWIQTAFMVDEAHMVAAIFGVFGLSWLGSLYRMIKLNANLKLALAGLPDPVYTKLGSIQRARRGEVDVFRYAGFALVSLGLIGTVIGFIIAIHSMHIDGLASDPGALVKSLTSFVTGLHVLMYSTACGVIANLWNRGNVFLMNRVVGQIMIARMEHWAGSK